MIGLILKGTEEQNWGSLEETLFSFRMFKFDIIIFERLCYSIVLNGCNIDLPIFKQK